MHEDTKETVRARATSAQALRAHGGSGARAHSAQAHRHTGAQLHGRTGTGSHTSWSTCVFDYLFSRLMFLLCFMQEVENKRAHTSADKKNVVKKAFEASLPKHVVNFVLVTIDKRRQRLLRSISHQYQVLLDAHMGREHVQVTVARPVDEATRELIAGKLSVALGKRAIPHFRVDVGILGGLVVRTGDTIYDGSVRRRMEGLRRQMLAADLPTDSGEAAIA